MLSAALHKKSVQQAASLLMLSPDSQALWQTRQQPGSLLYAFCPMLLSASPHLTRYHS
jgi:hypothetical protein